MIRPVSAKVKTIFRESTNGTKFTETVSMGNTIRALGINGRYKYVDANTIDCYQILDLSNYSCDEDGFNTGDFPCHDVYMTVDDYNYLISRNAISNLKSKANKTTSNNDELNRGELKTLIESQVYSTQIIGMTYLDPKSNVKKSITKGYSLLDNKMKIDFTVPESGNVLISCSFFRDSVSSNLTIYGALGDTQGNSLGDSFEKILYKADEVDDVIVSHEWLLTGLIAGESKSYTILLKGENTGMNIMYGGDYPAFIVKASVLPSTLLT
tara:strand:+ start:128 stop:931 length:804 start_codon:yes stop_codon:yes gene_type:complete